MADDPNWLETEALGVAAKPGSDGKKRHVAVAVVRVPPARVAALLKEFGAPTALNAVEFAGMNGTVTPDRDAPGPTLSRVAHGAATEITVALMLAPTDPDSDG